MSHEGVLKVLISDKMDSRCVEILEANAGITAEVDTGLSPDALQQRIGDYDGLIVRSSTKVTAEVLSAAPKLKVIGRAGTGFRALLYAGTRDVAANPLAFDPDATVGAIERCTGECATEGGRRRRVAVAGEEGEQQRSEHGRAAERKEGRERGARRRAARQYPEP
mgnify:CR=1 FL=1